MDRYYNGPKSKEMDHLYDCLMEHIDVTELNDWPILSLHIARILYNKNIGKEVLWKQNCLKD